MKALTVVLFFCLSIHVTAYCGDLEDDEISVVEPEELGFNTRNFEERVFLMAVAEPDSASMLHEENHPMTDASDAAGQEQQIGNIYQDGIDTDFNWGVIPYPRIYHDHGRQITRLKPAQEGEEAESWDDDVPPRGRFMIDQGSESDQHRVKDQGNFSFGVGAIGGIGSIFFSVGGIILPIYGKGASSERVISDYNEAKNCDRMKRPVKVEDLEGWDVGDSMVYWTKGGISLLAGVSATLANTGPGVTVNGEWLYEVKKESESRYTVAIRRVKIGNVKFRAGFFPIIRGLVGVAKNWGNNKVFAFNIDDARSHKLFNQSLKGKLRDVQLAAHLNPDIVSFLEEDQSVSNDRIRSFFVGFPLVYRWNVAALRKQESTFKQNHGENLNTTIERTTLKTGVYRKRLKNIFKKENRKNNRYKHVVDQSLSQVSSRITEDEDQNFTETGHYGELVWTYTNDVMTTDLVYKVISKLEKRSGIQGEIEIDFPAGMDQLGFTAIELKLVILEGTYQRILEKVLHDEGILAREAEYLIKKFSKPEHPMQLCRDQNGKLNKLKLRDKRRKLVAKLGDFRKSLADALFSGLTDKEKNLRFSKLGKMAMEDPLLLSVLRSLEPVGLELYFSISGESFRPFIKKIITDFD